MNEIYVDPEKLREFAKVLKDFSQHAENIHHYGRKLLHLKIAQQRLQLELGVLLLSLKSKCKHTG